MSTSALRLLAGTNQVIGKRLRAAPSAPDAVPEFMPKQNPALVGATTGRPTTRRVPRLANTGSLRFARRELCLRAGAGICGDGVCVAPYVRHQQSER
jgi:hypothetical protein